MKALTTFIPLGAFPILAFAEDTTTSPDTIDMDVIHCSSK